MPARRAAAGLAALLALVLLAGSPAVARALAQIKDSGTIVLCAHPNSLPFASKDGSRHGFQVELAQALARRLGVALTQNWVITSYDIFRADCDIVMDSIADRQAQAESGLRISKPYRRSGVAIAMRGDDMTIRSLDDLTAAHRKVGVLTSSIAAMKLSQGGAELVPGLFEDEMLAMLSNGEIDAAAVTPTSAGYYNLIHPKEGAAHLSLRRRTGSLLERRRRHAPARPGIAAGDRRRHGPAARGRHGEAHLRALRRGSAPAALNRRAAAGLPSGVASRLRTTPRHENPPRKLKTTFPFRATRGSPSHWCRSVQGRIHWLCYSP